MPEARVERGGNRTHELRAARGFSRSEILAAGVSLVEARSYGLRVDVRRRSKREENVAALNNWILRVRQAVKSLEPTKERVPVKEKPEDSHLGKKLREKRPRKSKNTPGKKEPKQR